MNNFPLYDSLISSVENEDLTVNEKNKFIKFIDKLDTKGYEYLYILIKMYSQQETDNKNYTLPFSGKYKGQNVQFNLEEFPFKLKQLLLKFIKTHIKAMKENEKISQKVSLMLN
jgi:hypothetical protein